MGMLVLPCKADGKDYIRISDDVWITVEEILPDNRGVRIGVRAPKDVGVDRKAVAELIDQGYDRRMAMDIANGKFMPGQEPRPSLPPARHPDRTEAA